MKERIISVFGSSGAQRGSDAYQIALDVGSQLARSKFIVCNGGYGGTMEASARGAKQAGGKTIGITASVFLSTLNQWIDQEIKVNSHSERMVELLTIADGYVVIRGGTGTLLEFSAAWEFNNKKIVRNKPLVFVGNFWKEVVDKIQQALSSEGQEAAPAWLHFSHDAEEATQFLIEYFSSNNNS